MKKQAHVWYQVEKGENPRFSQMHIPIQINSLEDIILLDDQPGFMLLKAIINHPESSEAACAIANKYIPSILNKIAYFYDLRIGKSQLCSVDIVSVRSDGQEKILNTRNPTVEDHESIRIVNVLTVSPDKLTALLKMPFHRLGDTYYKQYRIAIQSKDVIAEYMFLYSILLQIFGDKQKKVDKFIQSAQPDVKTFKKLIRIREEIETIYTKLRNEIAHVRRGKTFEQTIEEVNQHLLSLRELTKKAIEGKIGKCLKNQG
ncbi:hypothetical protein BST81_02150 [Leptolyngbya sp. 'hensonii']|uniref:methylamine utilization protein MauJ n=1 Tax=Leptolyngbya sp. 'hensonii' TaxID=1922337 RepID=UPI0009500325|nr:methylamine utilization protein MauJ [Leptolyngbya sp. 'hensonii']OLP20063.1 hypothetical protein BST81_02150 [Leptolyngbya sp. 'hensonii']